MGSRGIPKYKLHIDTETLEIINSYKYLGTFLAQSGSFLTARKHVVEQARKALFLLAELLVSFSDLQIKLFDFQPCPISWVTFVHNNAVKPLPLFPFLNAGI